MTECCHSFRLSTMKNPLLPINCLSTLHIITVCFHLDVTCRTEKSTDYKNQLIVRISHHTNLYDSCPNQSSPLIPRNVKRTLHKGSTGTD